MIFRQTFLHVDYTLIAAATVSKHERTLRQFKSAVDQHIQYTEQLSDIFLTLRFFLKLFEGPAAVTHQMIAMLFETLAKLVQCLCLTKRLSARKSNTLGQGVLDAILI